MSTVDTGADLATATDENDDEITPDDSASQVATSYVSSTTRKAAVLQVKANVLKKRHELELQEQKIRQMREQLEIEEELEMVRAESSSVIADPEVTVKLKPDVTTLNPNAVPWSTRPDSCTEIQRGMRAVIAAIHLPHAEITPFDGDPLQYWPFLRTFKDSIESVCDDEVSKLTRLLQYCTGKAKQAIRSCSVMPSGEGYAKALQLLKDRFGNEYTIAEAWIKTVTEGKQASRAESLREFADDLRNCKETLEAIGYISEVNTQQVIVKLVDRLPRYLQTRWVRHAGELRTKQHRAAQFCDVVDYVEAAAEEANDPVYGRFVDRVDSKSASARPLPCTRGDVSTRNKSRSFNTVASRVCLVCGADHSVTSCDEFKKATVDSRCQTAKTKGLCFNCLRPGHMATACRHENRCSVQGCGRKHSLLLHRVTPAASSKPAAAESNVVSSSCVSESSCQVTGAGARTMMLPLVPVKVQSADGQRYFEILALLDSGSTTSFCTERLAKLLDLPYRQETLTLSTVGAPTCTVMTQVVSLDVMSVDEHCCIKLDTVYTRPSLPVGSMNRATSDDIKKFPHLKGIPFYDAKLARAELLIGQDQPEALTPLEVRKCKGNAKAPFGVRTVLGWTVQGPVQASCNQDAVVNCVATDSGLRASIERFWRLDSIGTIADDDLKGMSVDDRKAMKVMEDTVQLKPDGHYELAIPFKQRPVSLPSNRPLAESRLQGIRRKLDRDSDLREKYCRSMDDLLTKGYASKVECSEIDRNNDMTWYLPHHAVINPNKPGKVRVVFDCAAKFHGVSLNDTVLQGPDLTNQLIGVLLRFRQEPVAVTADIEAMFCQVRVSESDRDCLRYLWWPNGDFSQEPDTYHMNIHLFGGTWSPSCCAFALRKVATDNQSEFSPDTVNTVHRNFYVDDCLKSVRTEEQAIELVSELIALLNRGGFRLTSFMSTSRRVLMSVPEQDRSRTLTDLDLCCGEQLPTERALGVSWNVEEDCFLFKARYKQAPLTRRGIVSTLCSVYDPAGFLTPFTLRAKLLVQEMTRKNFDWDEPLPEQDQCDWLKWLKELAYVEKIRIPRCLRTAGSAQERFELHYFADASNNAYGAVVYLRDVCEGTCRLLLAKSRLSPLKTVTIPRLELMAATLAVKLDLLVRRELDLPILRTIFWTDSSVVLHYISNDHKRFHTFVANRVAVIRETSDPKQWRHVPSAKNPADDVSRGLKAEELVSCSRWWNGPSFLMKPETSWPSEKFTFNLRDDDPEVKKIKPNAVSFVTASHDDSHDVMNQLFTRRSKWSDLKKDVAWICRFVAYLKHKRDKNLDLETGTLTVTELQTAEAVIVRYLQRKCFLDDVNQLNANDSVSRSSKLYRLCPTMMPDGTMCVGGRLRNASIPQIAKHPLILPRRHHVVDLIVRHEHETNGHVGREHVLSLLRDKYWIVSGRSTVRRVLGRCVTCKRTTARCGEQKMSDLPVNRVTADRPPFSYVGVDLFGPFSVRRGRSDVKRYGCIFTCLVTRAVHIEVVYSLDTDSFLNAVMRFISRRGNPLEMRSDNGTNFRAGDKELREGIRTWNQVYIANQLCQKEIKWQFNPPAASHMGGVWERLIRSIRNVLNSLLKEQTLDDESLYTVMCQAEHIVNSRPLTAISDDINDLEAITPVHLLNLRREPVLPPGIFLKTDNYVRRRWKQVQYMADVFWRRWTHEYLPLLQTRQKWCSTIRNFQTGDIVLLTDDSPRNCWPLARIIDVHCGDDGLVRSATVKTRTTTFVRPITKLCLLESVNDD